MWLRNLSQKAAPRTKIDEHATIYRITVERLPLSDKQQCSESASISQTRLLLSVEHCEEIYTMCEIHSNIKHAGEDTQRAFSSRKNPLWNVSRTAVNLLIGHKRVADCQASQRQRIQQCVPPCCPTFRACLGSIGLFHLSNFGSSHQRCMIANNGLKIKSGCATLSTQWLNCAMFGLSFLDYCG